MSELILIAPGFYAHADDVASVCLHKQTGGIEIRMNGNKEMIWVVTGGSTSKEDQLRQIVSTINQALRDG